MQRPQRLLFLVFGAPAALSLVEPQAVEVLADSRDATLTLVTCYPFDFIGPAPKRFIVRAHQIPGSGGGARAA